MLGVSLRQSRGAYERYADSHPFPLRFPMMSNTITSVTIHCRTYINTGDCISTISQSYTSMVKVGKMGFTENAAL